MDKYKVYEEDVLRRFRWNAPRYYDHPDGEDLIGKLSFTTKIAFVSSSVIGILSAHRAEGADFRIKLFRVAKVVVPAVGAAAAFTFVTFYSTVFRKKDDAFNYAFGGIAAGLVISAVMGKNRSIWPPIFIASGAVLKKQSKLEGHNMITPTTRGYFPSYYMRNWDTSMLSERQGNWTKGTPTK